MLVTEDPWRGQPVLLTGHTGFKGAWLSLLLSRLGAEVHGYALDPLPGSLFERSDAHSLLASDTRADIRSRGDVAAALRQSGARVVLHLAAQSVVSTSYDDPLETFSSNVLGTAVVLDALRTAPAVTACVVVTTDKVYRNREWLWGYREIDELGGDDPYSASKAAAELVTHAMAASFPAPHLAIATVRAGNVIGGGDTTPDALMPEVVDAVHSGRPIQLRHPEAVRPWQHVLEPLAFYLHLAESLGRGVGRGSWNVGPTSEQSMSVGDLVDEVIRLWGSGTRAPQAAATDFHETSVLRLDASKARQELGWVPRLTTEQALAWTVEWEKSARSGRHHPRDITLTQIDRYLRLLNAAASSPRQP